jgi:hypothetical protein
MMLFTAAKLGTLQGSAIVVVGERWGAESALIMGPGEATLTPSTLVRIQVPILEPVFHADSYGYRPGKSAIDAVRQARQRCWRCDWVLEPGSRVSGVIFPGV